MAKLKKLKFLLPVLFTFLLIAIFYFKRYIAIKFYPPIMDSFIFFVFFTSLFAKETVIQKFARLIDGDLSEPAKKYTRNLTYIWCVFLFINTIIAIATIFLSDRIWLLYNGFISYLLIGLLFAIEIVVRINFKRKHGLA